jgi:hypothetical protein
MCDGKLSRFNQEVLKEMAVKAAVDRSKTMWKLHEVGK